MFLRYFGCIFGGIFVLYCNAAALFRASDPGAMWVSNSPIFIRLQLSLSCARCAAWPSHLFYTQPNCPCIVSQKLHGQSFHPAQCAVHILNRNVHIHLRRGDLIQNSNSDKFYEAILIPSSQLILKPCILPELHCCCSSISLGGK